MKKILMRIALLVVVALLGYALVILRAYEQWKATEHSPQQPSQQATNAKRSRWDISDEEFNAMSADQHIAIAQKIMAEASPSADDLAWAGHHALAAAEKEPHNPRAVATRKRALVMLDRSLGKSTAKEKARMTAENAQRVDASHEILFPAYRACEDMVKDNLKAPASAQFADHWYETNAWHWRDHPGWVIADVTVDAQNSFGAMLRGTYRCRVHCVNENDRNSSLLYHGCTVKNISEIR